MLWTRLFQKRGEVKVTVTPKMVRDSRPPQDASTHQIWILYLKLYRRYAPNVMRTDGRTDTLGGSVIPICMRKSL